MARALASEVNVLAHMLNEISNQDRRARDFTRSVLRDAIRETIACFPVYRTYIDERGQVSDSDRRYIQQAIAGPSAVTATWRRRFSTSCAASCCWRATMSDGKFMAIASNCISR